MDVLGGHAPDRVAGAQACPQDGVVAPGVLGAHGASPGRWIPYRCVGVRARMDPHVLVSTWDVPSLGVS